MAARSYGQYCGLTTAVELIGERWALLIVRDLLVGPRRYTDLKQGLPRIPTNILSNRLKELQDGGVVRRVAMASCGLAYELTPYGKALEPIVIALGRWGFHAMGEPSPDDIVTADALTMALRTSFQPEHAPDAEYELHSGDIALHISVCDGALTVSPKGDATAEPDAVIEAGPGIRRLIAGEITATQAREQGIINVVHGYPALLDSFATSFHIPALGLD